jgi:hypothetical protein
VVNNAMAVAASTDSLAKSLHASHAGPLLLDPASQEQPPGSSPELAAALQELSALKSEIAGVETVLSIIKGREHTSVMGRKASRLPTQEQLRQRAHLLQTKQQQQALQQSHNATPSSRTQLADNTQASSAPLPGASTTGVPASEQLHSPQSGRVGAAGNLGGVDGRSPRERSPRARAGVQKDVSMLDLMLQVGALP